MNPTNTAPHIEYTISVKFRAAGITFANWTHSGTVQLPAQASLLDAVVTSPEEFFNLSLNGVSVKLTLVPPPTE